MVRTKPMRAPVEFDLALDKFREKLLKENGHEIKELSKIKAMSILAQLIEWDIISSKGIKLTMVNRDKSHIKRKKDKFTFEVDFRNFGI